jgi:hypothetical protein
VAELISVNLAAPHPNPVKDVGITGIDKRPAAAEVDGHRFMWTIIGY